MIQEKSLIVNFVTLQTFIGQVLVYRTDGVSTIVKLAKLLALDALKLVLLKELNNKETYLLGLSMDQFWPFFSISKKSAVHSPF